ncbi:MAG: DUF1045 domain-containing protein [Shimia sp.]
MFERYAIYVTADGAFGDAGASWLGWDPRTGTEGEPIGGPTTERPRKYGFHGTIKPPFRLAGGTSFEGLKAAAEALLRGEPAIALPPLQVARLGRFLALVPAGPAADLAALAGRVVEELDPFRAPPSAAEVARRRANGLTDRQEEMQARWGYPYVFDEFRFHMTLTGPLDDAGPIVERARDHFAPFLGRPLPLPGLTLLGERDGRFHEIAPLPFAA